MDEMTNFRDFRVTEETVFVITTYESMPHFFRSGSPAVASSDRQPLFSIPEVRQNYSFDVHDLINITKWPELPDNWDFFLFICNILFVLFALVLLYIIILAGRQRYLSPASSTPSLRRSARLSRDR